MTNSPIPTNIVTGFLGVGKTTAILHLLQHKPADERWAVLVNEFGEVGIDGAMLQDSGAYIKEVPGGCMCCAAGLPMSMALNMLIARSKPDRLLIEPTGLGHPKEVLETLTGDFYQEVLTVGATITLVDPQKLSQSRYTDNDKFVDQQAVADVLVANKTDQCDEQDKQRFYQWAEGFEPAKSQLGWVRNGELQLSWLDLPRQPRHTGDHPSHHSHHKHDHDGDADAKTGTDELLPLTLDDGKSMLRRENQGQGYVSCGWIFHSDDIFEFHQLFMLFNGVTALRLKAVMITERGIFAFNAENGVLSVKELEDCLDSRIEVINEQALDWAELEQQLMAARLRQA